MIPIGLGGDDPGEDEFWRRKAREGPRLPVRPRVCGSCAAACGFYGEPVERLKLQPAAIRQDVVARWFCHESTGRGCRGAAEALGLADWAVACDEHEWWGCHRGLTMHEVASAIPCDGWLSGIPETIAEFGALEEPPPGFASITATTVTPPLAPIVALCLRLGATDWLRSRVRTARDVHINRTHLREWIVERGLLGELTEGEKILLNLERSS